MHTHTKGREKNAQWISGAITGSASLRRLDDLVWERRCFTLRREKVKNASAFCHRKLPKGRTRMKNQNTKVGVKWRIIYLRQKTVYRALSLYISIEQTLGEFITPTSLSSINQMYFLVSGKKYKGPECLQTGNETGWATFEACEQTFTVKDSPDCEK